MKIIIGPTDVHTGASADTIFIVGESTQLAENNKWYWAWHYIFDTKAYVYKESPLGIVITGLIKECMPEARIQGEIDKAVIEMLSIDYIYDAIENIKLLSFESGAYDRASKIKSLLNISDY